MNETDPSEPRESSPPKYQDWPVAQEDTSPVQRGPVNSNPVFTILRIVIWLLPSIVVPILMVGIVATCNALNLSSLTGLITFFSGVAATMALGYFDQRISAHQQQIEFTQIKNDAMGNVGIFIVCQIFVIPIVWLTLIYGFCMIADN